MWWFSFLKILRDQYSIATSVVNTAQNLEWARLVNVCCLDPAAKVDIFVASQNSSDIFLFCPVLVHRSYRVHRSNPQTMSKLFQTDFLGVQRVHWQFWYSTFEWCKLKNSILFQRNITVIWRSVEKYYSSISSQTCSVPRKCLQCLSHGARTAINLCDSLQPHSLHFPSNNAWSMAAKDN